MFLSGCCGIVYTGQAWSLPHGAYSLLEEKDNIIQKSKVTTVISAREEEVGAERQER